VIRGALILAAGLAIGYGKGIQENVVALNKIEEMAKSLNAWSKSQPGDKSNKPGQEKSPYTVKRVEIEANDDIPIKGEKIS
jgi:hypothetical protein